MRLHTEDAIAVSRLDESLAEPAQRVALREYPEGSVVCRMSVYDYGRGESSSV